MAVPAAELPDQSAYVSRAGLKLHRALAEFGIDPAGRVCADFGCNAGGFTDCLLKHGAAKVYAIDTGYGALAWKLRKDERVVVMERTNALHAAPIEQEQPSLVVVDLGWTPQRLAVPAALRWLANREDSRVVTLIKPHYEVEKGEAGLLERGVLPALEAERIAGEVAGRMGEWGAKVEGLTRSPLLGGESKKNRNGNAEYLAVLARA